MRLSAALACTAAYLQQFDIDPDEARCQSRLLLAAALGLPVSQLGLHLDAEADAGLLRDLAEPLRRLSEHEPLQYVLGETEFFGLPLFCAPGVLIPRGDSEVLVEYALTQLPTDRDLLLADICCGSGCLGLALLSQRPRARLISGDISPQALALSERNAARHQLSGRVQLRQGDLLNVLRADERCDLIICNPPYISAAELAQLPANVQREPRLALDGGADGLTLYRRLLPQAAAHLTPGGLLVLEHGDGQRAELDLLLEQTGWRVVKYIDDLGRRPRGAAACPC